MKLTGRVVDAADLTQGQRDEMFALMSAYYHNMDRSTFEEDLDEKRWVIQVVDPRTGGIRGFSTQVLLDASVDGRDVRALFSGDTIVGREYWGKNPLARIWGRFALSLIDEGDSDDLYWFLITKGYKTYRYLPVFFDEFYPRFGAVTPVWAARIIDALASSKFSSAYNANTGIVRSGRSGCCLREGVADIGAERLRDPHVRYFTRRNPGHACGDELCCLAPLTRANFTSAAYRVIGSARAAMAISE